MWISAIASCARRLGRNPYETGKKSASKRGSSTSFNAAWTTRSATVGIPRLLTFPDPPGFGILRSRTGSGRNEPSLREVRSASRNPRTPTCSSTSATVRPSTPGVRAPVLPATRSNATISVAGSYTKLNRSSNLRPGSAAAHRCSLACIPDTRDHGPTGTGSRAPPFGGASFGITAPRLLDYRCRPSPCDRLSRPRTTTAAPPRSRIARRSVRPAHRPRRQRGHGQDPRRFPCSLRFAQRRRSPTVSLRYRHKYAADLPHGLHGRQGQTTREVPRPHKGGCAPRPAQIRQVRAGEGLRDVTNAGSSRTPLRPRSPGPHHLAVLAHPGFVGAAPTLPGTTRIRLPPASRTRCDRPEAKVSHLHSNQQRLTAQDPLPHG
jgi:hypothetical protein